MHSKPAAGGAPGGRAAQRTVTRQALRLSTTVASHPDTVAAGPDSDTCHGSLLLSLTSHKKPLVRVPCAVTYPRRREYGRSASG